MAKFRSLAYTKKFILDRFEDFEIKKKMKEVCIVIGV
jgi:hypothetical protein